MSFSSDSKLTEDALSMAFESRGKPEYLMFHSDQGCHSQVKPHRHSDGLAPNVAKEKYWNEYKTVAKKLDHYKMYCIKLKFFCILSISHFYT